MFKEVPAADSCYADQWAGSFLTFKIGLAFGIHFLYLHVRSKLRWYFQRCSSSEQRTLFIGADRCIMVALEYFSKDKFECILSTKAKKMRRNLLSEAMRITLITANLTVIC